MQTSRFFAAKKGGNVRNAIHSIWAMVILLLGSAGASAAEPRVPTLRIDRAIADSSQATVHIVGRGFLGSKPESHPTIVRMNGFHAPLAIRTISAQAITAALPSGLGDANYTLIVARGTAEGEYDHCEVAVGVVGPLVIE